MKGFGATKIVLFAAIVVLVLSLILAIISLFPVYTGEQQTNLLIDNIFTLSPNETYRQGLGSFHGEEKLSVLVQSPTALAKNFSIVTYNGSHFNVSSNSDVAYSFIAGADYYDAVFCSESPVAGTIHFQAYVQQSKSIFPYGWLTQPAKIMFLVSLVAVMLVMLKIVFSNFSKFKPNKPTLPSISNKTWRYIVILIVLSIGIWFLILAFSSSPLATFENWYTDHARHSYVSSLFLKDGFLVFNQPLNKLANPDNSIYKFVTWPEMPHLYPLGSIFLFLPFGALLQHGMDPSLIYKIEIALFLVFAHICLYFFLKSFLKKDLMGLLKAVGVYIIYVSLVIYAADGMFDSVAFIFSLFALSMFLSERYDYFFLLVTVSIFFKYQAGIFLFPLIIVGLIKLFQKNKLGSLLRNKAVVLGTALGVISVFTAYLSAPYLLTTGSHLIMNGINAFSPNTQIAWTLQSFSILLTLAVTLVYAFYMLNKNSLLSLSAFFLLLPSFMLPYFQNWYLPFVFVYVLVPQRKKELEVTMIWLIFMIFVLSFGGVSFNPLQIFGALKTLLRI